MDVDYSKVQAKEAYLIKEEGRCRLNRLLCSDGDCRTCNFITDSSLMLVVSTLHNDLEHVKSMIDPTYVPDVSGCDCAACNPDDQSQ